MQAQHSPVGLVWKMAGLCPSPIYSPPSRGKSFSFNRAYFLPSPAPLFQPHTQRLTPGPDQSKHRSMRDLLETEAKRKQLKRREELQSELRAAPGQDQGQDHGQEHSTHNWTSVSFGE